MQMDDEDFDDVEIGECFKCKQQRELVATMTITARTKAGEMVGSTDVDLCEECANATIREAAPLADSITIDGINAKDLIRDV